MATPTSTSPRTSTAEPYRSRGVSSIKPGCWIKPGEHRMYILLTMKREVAGYLDPARPRRAAPGDRRDPVRDPPAACRADPVREPAHHARQPAGHRRDVDAGPGRGGRQRRLLLPPQRGHDGGAAGARLRRRARVGPQLGHRRRAAGPAHRAPGDVRPGAPHRRQPGRPLVARRRLRRRPARSAPAGRGRATGRARSPTGSTCATAAGRSTTTPQGSFGAVDLFDEELTPEQEQTPRTAGSPPRPAGRTPASWSSSAACPTPRRRCAAACSPGPARAPSRSS